MDSKTDLRGVRDQALRTTRNAVATKAREVRDNIRDVKAAARDLAGASSSITALLHHCSHLLHVSLTGEPARIIARLMILSYYVNLVYTALETWSIMSIGEGIAAGGLRRPADRGPSQLHVPFPLLYVIGLLPVSVMAGAGLHTSWLFAGLLLLFTVCNDAWITWVHIKAAFMRMGVPSELVMKQLALIGSATLLLAHSIKDSPRIQRVTAGLLRVDDEHSTARPGMKRSTLLLLGRLMMAALLVYAGHRQVLHMQSRAAAARYAAATGQATPPSRHHYGRADPHDNMWLLVQCILAVPLALGLFTTAVTRLLCAVLLIEAITQWAWWGGGWPSWHYRQHIRDHFFLNTSVAGGLLLMQSMRLGGGLFAVDSLLTKQD